MTSSREEPERDGGASALVTPLPFLFRGTARRKMHLHLYGLVALIAVEGAVALLVIPALRKSREEVERLHDLDFRLDELGTAVLAVSRELSAAKADAARTVPSVPALPDLEKSVGSLRSASSTGGLVVAPLLAAADELRQGLTPSQLERVTPADRPGYLLDTSALAARILSQVLPATRAELIAELERLREAQTETDQLAIFSIAATAVLTLLLGIVLARLVARTLERSFDLAAEEERSEPSEELTAAIRRIRTSEKSAQESRDQALQASRAKSDFLAMISHEVRTPLNAVVGMTSLLLESPLDARQREQAEAIRLGGETLLGLINQILDFSKIEAGRLELEPAPFDAASAIEAVVDLLSVAAGRKRLDLVWSVGPEVPDVLVADAARLTQILFNVVGNAVKFTERGEVVVTASFTGDELQLAVRDTGPGITDEARNRLFEPFRQLDASTARKHEGTGLGLAISKRLAELMGGRLTVESVPGRGSTFHVAVRATPSQARPASSTELERPPSGRVLVVEDGTAARQALAERLRRGGATVVEAASTSEALEAVSGCDAVLLDADLASLVDPRAFVAELARHAGRDRLPTVLLSYLDAKGSGDEIPVVRKAARRSTLWRALRAAITGSAEPARAPAPAVSAAGAGTRVLLVEDNPMGQRVALLTLESLGVRADCVGSGAEAISLLGDRSYDLVLMDMMMPGLDGLETTRRIRAELPAERQPRIVAMTANALPEDRAACLAAGMDDYLTKPIRKGAVAEVLRRNARVEPRRGPASLDENVLDELSEMLGPGVVPSLIKELGDTLPEHRAAIAAAIAAGDTDALRRSAHTLKGVSAQLGLSALASACEALERHARAGLAEPEASRLRERIETEAPRALDALRRRPVEI